MYRRIIRDLKEDVLSYTQGQKVMTIFSKRLG